MNQGSARSRGNSRNPEREDVFTEQVIKINRCATVVKGGRRFSFSALVVVGDGKRHAGVGFGKAKEVPSSVEKAIKNARSNVVEVSLTENTIAHMVTGRFGAAHVVLIPAKPGTGVIAGSAVRAVMEAVGIKDVLSKSFGSNNPVNLTRATLAGLRLLKPRAEVEQLRGVALP